MQILTVILIVVLSALTLVLLGILMTFISAHKRVQSTSGFQLKKNDIEELLAKGNAASAQKAAVEWIRREPKNTTAFMLLAKSSFRLGEYVEAKKAIEELVEFAPEFEFPTRWYSARIKDKLKESRPRSVE
jgi:predicted Zn-dependent protease